MKLEIVKSPVMLKSQVEIVYARLNEAPKLYETDGVNVKEVAVKLFHPVFTLYVVEYDPNDRLAFGYMKNESDDYLSEWGYSSIDELIGLGFEMDLYFEDRVIASDGSISKRGGLEMEQIKKYLDENLETVIEGYEPSDLLRLSKDAFYDVVNQYFLNIEIIEMKLSFEIVNEEVVIKAKIIEYKEEI
jgi:hypothetical protein